jgi:hypothetical protein
MDGYNFSGAKYVDMNLGLEQCKHEEEKKLMVNLLIFGLA